MGAILYPLFAVCYVCFLVWGLRLARRSPGVAVYCLIAMVGGLLYDNLVISLGWFIRYNFFIITFNFGRYLLHALLVPLLIVIALDLARRGGLEWARRPWVSAVAWVGSFALAGYGLVQLKDPDMKPLEFLGTYRFVVEHLGPPVVAILGTLVTLAVGAALWWRRSWPWLFAGALTMLMLAALPGDLMLLRSQIGEVLLMLAFLATAQWGLERA